MYIIRLETKHHIVNILIFKFDIQVGDESTRINENSIRTSL